MTHLQQRLATGKGKFTLLYPDLGTGPVSYEGLDLAGSAGPPARHQKWVYRVFRAGLFGPDDVPDLGPLPEFLNKGRIRSWGNDQFWLFPNLSIQIWARGYYITYSYWPEAVDRDIYEIDLYFVPPTNAQERLAQESSSTPRWSSPCRM